MVGTEHATFAIITTTTLCVVCADTNIPVFDYPGVAILTGLLGGLAPDIDMQKSTIGQLLPNISKVISHKFGHRTVTHDMCLTLILAVICVIICPFSLCFWFGVLGHLFLDSLTYYGVHWRYFKNGKHFEEKALMSVYGFNKGVVHLVPRNQRVCSGTPYSRRVTFRYSILISLDIFLLGFAFQAEIPTSVISSIVKNLPIG